MLIQVDLALALPVGNRLDPYTESENTQSLEVPRTAVEKLLGLLTQTSGLVNLQQESKPGAMAWKPLRCALTMVETDGAGTNLESPTLGSFGCANYSKLREEEDVQKTLSSLSIHPTMRASAALAQVATLNPDSLQVLRISAQDAMVIDADIIAFGILTNTFDPRSSPVGTCWTAGATAGAISEGTLTLRNVREHVTQNLMIDPGQFTLWNGGSKLTFDEFGERMYSLRHNVVHVLINPFLHVQKRDGTFYVISFWDEFVNKAFIPIRNLKDRVRQMHVQYGETWGLYLGDTELLDDSISLHGTGLLTAGQTEGLEPIMLTIGLDRPKKTCMTCIEDFEQTRFPNSISARCDHTVSTCKGCVRRWIDERLTSQGYDMISCPECRQKLEYEDVQNISSRTQFEK
jgi:hypothetical protein